MHLQIGRDGHVDVFAGRSDAVEHHRVVERRIPGGLKAEECAVLPWVLQILAREEAEGEHRGIIIVIFALWGAADTP